MSNKKRMQNLVWDGLFNGLENKAPQEENSSSPKKGKKSKEATNNKPKPEGTTPSE